jgi:hypothetical protein
VPVADLQRLGLVDEHGDPVIDPARNMKTVDQGAATSVWCATSPQLDGLGGVYCENSDIAPLVSEDTVQARAEEIGQFGSLSLGVLSYAVDPEAAARLWTVSERLTSPPG